MTVLLLVRHGLTDVTGKLLTGQAPGIHLSDRGREQADAIPARLERLPLAAIYSSPLERCRETAAPLAAGRGVKVQVRSGLTEVGYGDWTGRPLKQLARTKLWRRIQQVPSGVRFPAGESLMEVQERAVATTQRIAAEHPTRAVAVFSHADVIKLVLAYHAGMHLDLFQRLVIETASVSVLSLGDGPPRILKMNDTGSLELPHRPRTSRRRGPAPKVGG